MKVMIAIIVDMVITVNAMMIAFPRENEIVAVIKNIDTITRVRVARAEGESRPPKKGEGRWAVGRPAGDDGPRDLEPHLFNIIDVRSTCIHHAHI